jgi:CheY-like chemotaxis protein/HPt (histidine-containing phosphotransfer) domain-containing protein
MMLSSAGQAGDAARCRELGVATYLTKPIRQSQLLDAIMTAIQGSGAGGHGAAAALVAASDLTPGPWPLTPAFRILLAEDNEVNQKLAVRILEKRGHTVVVANNGREALAALETGTREAGGRFDLVLMDVQMPEIGGFEATAAIREKEKQAETHLPIVAMTAHAMKGDRERCLEAGMDGYVTKPIQPQQLFEAIEEVISRDKSKETRDEGYARDAGTRMRDEGVKPDSHSSSLVPHPSSLDPEVLDKTAVLKRVGGDLELLQELLDLFLHDCPQQLAAIREAIAGPDSEALERAAHRIKGAVGTFGARAAVEAALRLETMGREGDLTQAEAAYAALEAGIQRLKPALAALVAENG